LAGDLQARTLPNQKIEAKIGCNVLNRMTGLDMPVLRPAPLMGEALQGNATCGRSMHQRAGKEKMPQSRDHAR
jgi:hypothetical protein